MYGENQLVQDLREERDDLTQDLKDVSWQLDNAINSIQGMAYEAQDRDKEIKRLNAQINVRKKLAETREEQFRQVADNAQLLGRTLRRVHILAWHSVKGDLFDCDNDISRVESNASYWQHRAERAEREAAFLKTMLRE